MIMESQTLTTSPNIASDAKILARYKQALQIQDYSPTSPVTETSSLIPEIDIPLLESALNRMMKPATARERAGFIAALSAAWPHAHQKTDDTTLDLFVRMLDEEIAKFPADILTQVLRELRRTLKSSPSIAEIYQEAACLLVERVAKLRLLQAQPRFTREALDAWVERRRCQGRLPQGAENKNVSAGVIPAETSVKETADVMYQIENFFRQGNSYRLLIVIPAAGSL
jgi:hypothetical protein